MPASMSFLCVLRYRTNFVYAVVRAFSLLFGVAKAIYRRRYGETCAYGHIHSILCKWRAVFWMGILAKNAVKY